ncbi:MAG: GlcG/HbpS family heme-binding protein [Stellaceae bacterium]
MSRRMAAIVVLAGLAWAGAVRAQTVTPYGMPIGLDAAKKAVAAAAAEAAKITKTPYVIAVVDPDGQLIYFERQDDAQIGSVRVAIDKARSAALFRRPTKVFADALGKGGTAILTLHGAVANEGGLPLIADGKVVGAIGASAGTGAQDGQVAKAGADTLK